MDNKQSVFISVVIAGVLIGALFAPPTEWAIACYFGLPCNLFFLAGFILIMYSVYRIFEVIPDRRIFVHPIPDILDKLLVIEIINRSQTNDFTELRIELEGLKLVGHRDIFFDDNKSLFHVGRGNEQNKILAGKSAAITLAVAENGITKFLTDAQVTNNLFRKVKKPPSDVSSKWKVRLGGKHKRAYYQFIIEISGKMGGDRISHTYKGTSVHWISEYDTDFDTIFREIRPAEIQFGLNWVKWAMWLRVGKHNNPLEEGYRQS